MRVGDVHSPRAFGFGVTAEISTLVPYRIPQLWAAALHSAGLQGIVYQIRHDPLESEALAIFGQAGHRSSWPTVSRMSLEGALVHALTSKYGIEVLEKPSSSELRIID